jgi:glucose/arabinose dehydrogenase
MKRAALAAARATVFAAALALLACSDTARLPPGADTGPNPTLGAPRAETIPTVNIAPAAPWPADTLPVPANGLAVEAFASGLAHPRWLHVLPNGDVLVAETNAPQRPERDQGLRAWFMKRVMARAGAAVPSANRITLLRDTDGDGRAERREVFLSDLNSPFGMALVGNRFFVANTDAVWSWPYTAGDLRIAAAGTKLVDLPAGPLNHHWTKSLIAHPDGRRLYATVGSNSNVAEHGMDKEEGRAAIWEIDIAAGTKRLFATGLRNPNGMAWVADAQQRPVLWTVVNERDEIGSDLVPDYLTSVRDGGFYGWPYSWFGRHVDERVQPQRPERVARALVPDYALGAHVAALGLAHSATSALPVTLTNQPSVTGVFIGEHGSWNRKPRSGYKVVFVPFEAGRPSGPPVDVLGGFISPDGKAWGRPVGVAVDPKGGLLVADDVGNTIWRVTVK